MMFKEQILFKVSCYMNTIKSNCIYKRLNIFVVYDTWYFDGKVMLNYIWQVDNKILTYRYIYRLKDTNMSVTAEEF
jgi:hypothetical protein